MSKCSKCQVLSSTQCSDGGFIPSCDHYSNAIEKAPQADSAVTRVMRQEMQEAYAINSEYSNRSEQVEYLDTTLCIDAEREGIFTDCTKCDMLLACAIVMAENHAENKGRFEPRARADYGVMWKFADCTNFVNKYRKGENVDPTQGSPIENVAFDFPHSVPELTPKEKATCNNYKWYHRTDWTTGKKVRLCITTNQKGEIV